MTQVIQNLQQDDLKAMLKEQGVSYLGLFGSYARGEETQESDVDLMIDFDEIKSLFDLADIKIQLQEKLGRKVELSMRGYIKESLKSYINKDLITVYEKN
jgi:uncharacterized protein